MSQSYYPVSVTEAKAIYRQNNSKTMVDLCCRICAVGLALRTRGSDYSRTLKVIDSSSLSPFAMVFFAQDVNNLPKVRSVGDIIIARQFEESLLLSSPLPIDILLLAASVVRKVEDYCARVPIGMRDLISSSAIASITNVKMYDQEVFCSFNKKSSTYLLFHRNSGMNLDPYEISLSAHLPNHVNATIHQLRALSLGDQSTSGLTEHLLSLKDIKIGGVFDMVCKVVNLHDASRDEWTLYVWDGLDAPPLSLQSDLDMEVDGSSSLYAEQVPLPTSLLCTFPNVGTVLRISIHKNLFQDISRFQNDIYWVKLCNLSYELSSGFWKGVMDMSFKSKVFILSEEDYIVQDRLRDFYDRMLSHRSRMPLASFPEPSHVTGLSFEDPGYATLMESLTHSKRSHQLKSIVRVVASVPWKSGDLLSLYGQDYGVRLTLEDPTARIHAYIFGDDIVEFFGANSTSDELSRKMNKLLGIEGPNHTAPRNPPWVYCYLRSFQESASSDGDLWSSRKYLIFGTRLVG